MWLGTEIVTTKKWVKIWFSRESNPGDREVGQDFADFVYEIYADDFCQHFVAYFAFCVGVFYLMIRGS